MISYVSKKHCADHVMFCRFQLGYKAFPYHQNISKRLFGGILLFVKKNLRNGVKILENDKKDKLWIKLKKDFFGLEKDIFICFAYIPPASSEYVKNLTYDLIDDLSEEIGKFQVSRKYTYCWRF